MTGPFQPKADGPAGPTARVLAVVVTYRPEPGPLRRLLEALAAQEVDEILVVDNTPGEASGPAPSQVISGNAGETPISTWRMGANSGIGAAQNVGIRKALAEGFDYVLLSDQDSEPRQGMVEALVECCAQRSAAGPVGCVAPAYHDRSTGQDFAFQVMPPGALWYRSLPADRAIPAVEIITTISSGSLIPRSALEAVGGMREDFFIDHVDTEWCHRARAAGHRNYGTALARLEHALGGEPFRVWYGRWRVHSEYPPSRLYYRFRNFVRMARLPHVPLRWTVRAAWYWAGNAYAHVLFARRRMANLRAILLGMRDGVMDRRGPAPEDL